MVTFGSRVPRVGPRLISAFDRMWGLVHPYRWRAVNARARRRFDLQRPVLTPAQRRMVADLSDGGIAHAPLSEVMTDAAVWPTLLAVAKNWLADPAVFRREQEFRSGGYLGAKKKEFIVRLYGDGAHVPAESPWLQLALRPDILDVVNSYLGVLSVLQYVDVWNTIAIGQPQRFTGSQNWHRDPEDCRIVKAFLYLSDVDEGAGPMHYVPHSRPGEAFGHLWSQRFPDGSYPPADEFERHIPRSRWTVCAHRAGTLVLADTVGFHMGGRATTKNRVLATWCYATPGSAWGRGFSTDAADMLDPNDPRSAARRAALA